MKAIILAAGRGIRLMPLTEHTPKCLLEINGTSILENCLKNLHAIKVDKIIIVVGHLHETIINKIGYNYQGIPIKYVFAEQYANTNNIVSLWLTREEMDEDLFLIESDIFFGDDLLTRIVNTTNNIAVVSQLVPGMKGTVVTTNAYITDMYTDGYEGFEHVFKTVNIYYLKNSFLKLFVPFLDAYIKSGYTKEYYEVVIADLISKNKDLFVPLLTNNWAEVDDIEDLHKARYKFGTKDQQYETVMNLYGYFWPYGVKDHCHLYNMYFPPAELLEYMQSHLPTLITTYPSAHREIAYYLAQYLGIKPEYLAIGNGASELIRIIGNEANGFCVSTPSFNEFETAASEIIKVPLDQDTWQFNRTLFIEALNNSRADYGIIVTPNNPTSVAVSPADIQWVLEHTDKNIIVDESFIDFSSHPSVLPWIEIFPNLIVMKSLGKAFGICGLRLGYIATTNKTVDRVRQKLPIWNINNFAETFVRQISRYENKFKESCEKTRHDRRIFYDALCHNAHLRVWEPDGNFVLIQVEDGDRVARRLFDHNILVKPCSNKTMKNGNQYLRIGCRTPVDNACVAEALIEILTGSRKPVW